MIEILDIKLAAAALDLDFSAREDPAVMIAENRNQQLVPKLFFVRLPIDIEINGIAAGGPVLQYIPPEPVAASADGHVIRDQIEDLAETARAEPE